jgi:hypothetical protein
MNRLAGFALIGGVLASFATASGAAAKHLPYERNASRAASAVQVSMASVEQSVPPVASLAPATTMQRIIQASQAQTRAATPPASAEVPPAGQASAGSCPPASSAIACRKP